MCEKAGKGEKKESVKKEGRVGLFLLALIDFFWQWKQKGLSGGEENAGFGWGLPFSLGWQGDLRWSLVLLSALVWLGVFYWYFKSKKEGEKTGLLMLLLGGGVNLLMRLFWGKVIDYLCCWGLCFNLADILITGGVILVINSSWKKDED